MVKILIDLSKDEDKIVEIYKLVNGLKTKQEAIKHIPKITMITPEIFFINIIHLL